MLDKNFRLPTSIRPTTYRFRVAPQMHGAHAGTFHGSGTIDLVLDHPVRAITLHGAHLTVEHAALQAAGRAHPATVSAHAESQTLTFAFDGDIPAGAATLTVRFHGLIHQDLRGLYQAGPIAVTQFEAADARRLFPSFDEPPFKAVWEIAVEAPPGDAVIGNGAVVRDEIVDGKRVVTFAPTPLLSSYLVAIVVGPLVASEARAVGTIPLRTWSVAEKAHLTSFAQTCAAAVLPLLEHYFKHPYVFGKVDQVGIPDFEAGAMENAGCITFREIALLLDEHKAPLNVKKRVAEVITHELAHQWFGNLVTMQWWDDLWLNEAFATWMAYKIVDEWMPGWRMWDDFEQGKADALHLDALESTHPIRCEVKNADEATENFDAITYEKGGAMLRMIEGYLGEDAFRAGIRLYMREHAYKNAVADDLWRALARASGQPIEELANGWIGRGGYPLVELDREGDLVRVRQRRFHADPARMRTLPDEPWPVPLVLRFADAEGVKEARALLRDREATIRLDAAGPVRFVCGNLGGAGFYRVQYTPEGLAELMKHAIHLAPVERMNLVADAWALFRAGAAPLAPALDLLFAFARDKDYVVLSEVVSRLDGIERRFAAAVDRPRLRRLIGEALAPHLPAVGWDAHASDDDGRRLRRAAVIRGLATVARAPGAVAEAQARLRRFLDGDHAALDANLLDAACLAAARAGNAALFDEFLARKAVDPDPAAKRRLLVGLASFEEPGLAGRAISHLLDDGVVAMQDVTTYAAALLGNDAARDRAFHFIRDEWPRVHAKSRAPMLTRRMVEALGTLLHRRGDVESFFDAEATSFAAAPSAIRQTRERLRLDEDVYRRASVELGAWLDARDAR